MPWWIGLIYEKKQTSHTHPKDTRTLQISKACQENQASVSVYMRKCWAGSGMYLNFIKYKMK